jgi:putative ABC transport system permease protein
MDFYRFPFLIYELRPQVVVLAVTISAGAAVAGCLFSVLRAAAIAPAEAMQPAPPAKYRLSVVERLGLRRRLAQPTRMIVRNLERRPVKSFFTITGIAAACAILLMGGFYSDAVDEMVGLQLRVAQRDDLSVTFVEPAGRTALYSLSVLPSVEYVEPFRNVPVRIRHEHHQYRTSLRGVPGNSLLYRLLDDRLRRVDLEPGGVVLTDFLAKTLGIRVGDRITLEVLEGRRLSVQVPVTGTVKEYIGVFAYMRLEDIARLLREQESYSGAYLRTDPRFEPALLAELKGMPRVAGTAARLKMLNNFYETLAKQMLTFAFFNTLLAASIAFGVVYNSARIAFSERSRELASLRVLGFTRGEISYILLGEMALLTLAAIPPGFLLGHGLCRVMVAGMQNELFRIPVVISDWSHAFAAAVVLGSALVSAAIVRRKLDHLDLVAVLKTKE